MRYICTSSEHSIIHSLVHIHQKKIAPKIAAKIASVNGSGFKFHYFCNTIYIYRGHGKGYCCESWFANICSHEMTAFFCRESWLAVIFVRAGDTIYLSPVSKGLTSSEKCEREGQQWFWRNNFTLCMHVYSWFQGSRRGGPHEWVFSFPLPSSKKGKGAKVPILILRKYLRCFKNH
jgi:hypothetical protein